GADTPAKELEFNLKKLKEAEEAAIGSAKALADIRSANSTQNSLPFSSSTTDIATRQAEEAAFYRDKEADAAERLVAIERKQTTAKARKIAIDDLESLILGMESEEDQIRAVN